MTVGFDAPLPPARTGVADYAAKLLEGLRRHGTVEVRPRRADVRLYHIGNNPLHREIYRRALAEPGVVVLHDAVLHHFLLGSLSENEYIEEFVYNYGEWYRGLAGELWRGRAASAAREEHFRYPMLKRIVTGQRAVVVHNPAAAAMVRRHAPGTPLVEIPLLFRAPHAEASRFRARHGIPEGVFLFGVLGHLRESKRLLPVLRAFAKVPGGAAALLVAGDFVSTDLERAAAPLLARPGVWRLPYQRDLWSAASALDACINLRYPTAGETSDIAVQVMGLGKPVLVTASEEYGGFPDTACLRVEAGPSEEHSLWSHMVLLTSVAGAAAEIGRRAAARIRERHTLEGVAAQYWNTLCEYRC